MVVFTCQFCNANLKRKDIPGHKFRCKRNLWLTCIDCLKDFKNDEYEVHLQCITEDQKYGGKNYVAKETGRKQNLWMAAVRRVIQNGHSDGKLSELLAMLEPYNNVPRNQKKFENFAKNSFGSLHVALFNRAYELFTNEFSKETTDQENGKKRPDDSGGEKENNGERQKRKNRDDHDDVKEEAEGDVSPTKPKKKKKNRSAPDDNVAMVEEEVTVCETTENGQETIERQDEVPDAKLTKRMKKQKKKLEKYQAEIQEIQNFKEQEIGENEDEPPKKKKKKKEAKVVEGELAEHEVEAAKMEVAEDVATVQRKVVKFDWSAVIKEVLAGASDKEMSLKKLGKKVISEYWRMNEANAGGTHETDPNKVQARFDKKVAKTEGVKILKDRARLVS